MSSHTKSLAAAIILGATLLAASALYAHDSMPMGNGAMGSGPGNMMNMMGQMSEMAQNCNAMMSNRGAAPNSQWNRDKKSAPRTNPEPRQQ